ncbi:MAG: aldehyde dehydrogenase family protein [Solirubrobacterales bacterium]|nr:aldehyde dehydrogenase family protein [Solirubrobacterales bacterium]
MHRGQIASNTVPDPVVRYLRGRDLKMLVGGKFVDASDGTTSAVVDPSTGEVVGAVPSATGADVERAVETAREAQGAWEALGVDGRGACFQRFAELLQSHREELAVIDAIVSGNPVRAMRVDIDLVLPYLRGWPQLARWLTGEVIPGSAGNLHYTSYRPYGVVGRITAFNHPVMFAATRPLPALIAGNTIVMKPAPPAAAAALVLAESFAEAFPPGVVNIVTGGAQVGDALVTHDGVKRIAFTGSVPTALTIQRRAAESGHVKHISLELGGKNAMVVFPDFEIDEAVEGAIFGMNFNVCQGQSCGSNSRVLVHRAIYDGFVSRAAQRLREYTVGVAYEDATDMGPLVSANQRDRVAGYLETGMREGATLVTGGEHPEGAPVGGYFLTPAVFADVKPTMRIAQEEIFGPVLSVLPWGDYEEMLALANGVNLGLTASVWTHDLDLAHQVAERLDAGYVWVNDSAKHYFGTPFGGTKDSGIGREESREELLSYMETKVVNVRFRDPPGVFVRMISGR